MWCIIETCLAWYWWLAILLPLGFLFFRGIRFTIKFWYGWLILYVVVFVAAGIGAVTINPQELDWTFKDVVINSAIITTAIMFVMGLMFGPE